MAAYSIEDLMADVAGLFDASDSTETVLIAHDWGAVIAWYFAMRKLRPLSRLIICNVPHPRAMAQRQWAKPFAVRPAIPSCSPMRWSRSMPGMPHSPAPAATGLPRYTDANAERSPKTHTRPDREKGPLSYLSSQVSRCPLLVRP
jgi:pimeloyl-ACP methyl ester carboxylesterase